VGREILLLKAVKKEGDEFQSLLGQKEWDKMFSKARECLAEALEHAENSMYGEYISHMSMLFLIICGYQCRHYLNLCKSV
jgi:TRAP-type mannitol/chloroaromatic compound transport system substrate-binding protein